MDNFINPSFYKQFVIFNGNKIEANEAYRQIYSLAKSSIIIIDDYISPKTLGHRMGILGCLTAEMKVNIFNHYIQDKKLKKH